MVIAQLNYKSSLYETGCELLVVFFSKAKRGYCFSIIRSIIWQYPGRPYNKRKSLLKLLPGLVQTLGRVSVYF